MDVTIEQVTETIREIVKGNEDYVYEDAEGGEYCTYSTPDGAPSCIVGHVINRLAPEKFESIHLSEWSEEGVFGVNFGASIYDYSADEAANEVLQYALRRAQMVQDSGGTWGQALEEYEGVVRDHE